MHLMKRMYSWSRGTRRRTAVVASVLALVLAGTAAAAWIIFTGAQGSSYGKFGTAQTNTAIVFTQDSALFASSNGVAVVPGTSGDVALDLNNVTTGTVSLNSVSGDTTTFVDSAHPACASHLTLNTAAFNAALPFAVSPGATGPSHTWLVPGAISADASTPAVCSGDPLQINLVGLTTP